MSRLTALFKNQPKDLLNIYFTAGYPGRDDTETIIESLAAAGTDLIEIGMPYSDPLADGPTIQRSGMQALENGMTLELLFTQIKRVRPKVSVPLILMGYFNQVMQFGEERFLAQCQEAGVDGLILPDLPLDVYEADYHALFAKYQMPIVFLITPQTSEARIRKIDALSQGFIYMVSSAAITGAKSGITDKQLTYFNRINAMGLATPRLIGFGISDHATFTTACKYAHGAIIGSAFIRALAVDGELEAKVNSFVRGILSTE